MAIDAGLFAQLGTRPRSYGDYRQEVDTQAANALALKGGNLQYQNALQAMQDEAAYRDAARGFGADQTANYNALLQRGLPKQAMALQKSALDAQKVQADIGQSNASAAASTASAGKTRIDAMASKLGYGQKVLQTATSPEQAALLMKLGIDQGVFSQDEAASFLNDMPADPNAFNQWREQQAIQGMDIAKKLDLQRQEQTDRQKAANEMMIPDPNNPGKFIPNRPLIGAKAEVSRAGAASVNNYGSPMAGVDAEGKPVFFQPTKTGGAPSIVPGVRPPPQKDASAGQPTEDERKAAGYAIRMEGALKKLEEVGRTNPEALKPGVGTSLINMAPEGVANYMRPEARQRVETAQVDALDAALTLATGAAYTKEQLKGLSRSYFTQPGDDPATIKDKEQRLAEVIETARIRAGRAAPSIDKMNAARPAAPAQTGAFSDAEKERRYQEWKARQK